MSHKVPLQNTKKQSEWVSEFEKHDTLGCVSPSAREQICAQQTSPLFPENAEVCGNLEGDMDAKWDPLGFCRDDRNLDETPGTVPSNLTENTMMIWYFKTYIRGINTALSKGS